MDYDIDNWDGIKVPQMEYTYKGKYEMKDISSYSTIYDVLAKDPKDISREEVCGIVEMKESNKVVCDFINHQLIRNDNPYLIRNCFMCLLECGDENTLPTLLEVLRQDNAFRKFHFDGLEREYITPLLYKWCKDNPEALLSYLLEPGLNTWFKTLVLESLAVIANTYPEAREDMFSMLEKVLPAYKEDLYSGERKICDGNVVGFALLIPIALWAEEYIPVIEEYCASGLVDYGIIGKIQYVRRDIRKHKVFYDIPANNAFDILTKAQGKLPWF